jgi:hypothetical protein
MEQRDFESRIESSVEHRLQSNPIESRQAVMKNQGGVE